MELEEITMMHILASAVLTKKFIGISSLSLFVIALSDPTAFAAAAVLVIGAIGGASVLIINAIGKMKTDVLAQQALLAANVEVVKGHVDGTATTAAVKRNSDEEKIASLTAQLADSERRAALLAQAKTNVDIAAAVPMNKETR